jgi:hypothetical protein
VAERSLEGHRAIGCNRVTAGESSVTVMRVTGPALPFAPQTFERHAFELFEGVLDEDSRARSPSSGLFFACAQPPATGN